MSLGSCLLSHSESLWKRLLPSLLLLLPQKFRATVWNQLGSFLCLVSLGKYSWGHRSVPPLV